MPRNTTPLALLALLAIGAAIMAGLARQNAAGPDPAANREATPTDQTPGSQTPTETRERATRDPVEEVAAAYALAARAWTPASYRASWERQIALAGGRYGRELQAQRPGPAEIGALRADHARSEARLVDVRRDPDVPPPAARVLVTLEEKTVAAGQTIAGPTVNEVGLRRAAGRWRVVAFTVVPGGATPSSDP